MPTWTSKKITPSTTAASTPSVSQCLRLERLVRRHRRRRRPPRCAGEQLPAAEQEVADEGHDDVRQQVVAVGRPLVAARGRSCVITPLTMMPVGANGDSAPACAPLPTMIAIRNGGMPACAPTAMRHRRQQRRRGDVARADRGEHDSASDEEHHRDDAGVAAAERAPRACARRRSVPLTLRLPKSSVTPASVRKSGTGKRADHRRCSGMPPR